MSKHGLLSVTVSTSVLLGIVCLGCATPQGGTVPRSKEDPRVTLSQDESAPRWAAAWFS